MLDTKGGDLVDKLGRKQAELAAALDHSTQSLNDALAAGAAASVNSLVTTHHQVRGGMGEAIAALNDKNSDVQRTVESAQAAFAAIESGLGARIAEFEHATFDINRRIDTLSENAGTTVSSAQALFETIAHQQEALTAAAVDLSRSQAELDISLNERRTALENLLANVQARREEIDGVTTTFTHVVEEAFQRAEIRAHEIGTFLANTSQTTADQAERQFGDIRNSISSERDRTVELLRTAYEQASAEIDDVFGQSTARFQAATTDMRGMAQEIGTFLTNTSQTTASQAERQFGDIRNSISSERDRTVDLLRTAYEQASAEMEDIFGQSTSRFQAAATDMRGMAEEIGTFLVNTSETTASQAERQFGDIRNSISNERDRTVDCCARPTSRPAPKSRIFSASRRRASRRPRPICAAWRARFSGNSNRPAKNCAATPSRCRRKPRSRRRPCAALSPTRSRP